MPESVFSFPDSVFSMAGFSVQHRPEFAFSFNRNQRSAWAGARTLEGIPSVWLQTGRIYAPTPKTSFG
jgi:hypothetical protein